MVIYTDKFIPFPFKAITLGPITLMQPSARHNIQLQEHEAIHRAQFSRNWLMPFLYLFSKRKRLEYEAEAFVVQYKAEPTESNLYDIIFTLEHEYHLGLPSETIRSVLLAAINK